MRRLAYLGLAAVAALSLVAAACGDDDDDDNGDSNGDDATEVATDEPTEVATDEPTEAATDEPTEAATDEPTEPGDGDGEPGSVVEITAAGVAFDQAAISVAADTPFTVQLVNNDDGIPHSFAIPSENLTTGVESGVATLTLEVDGLAAGDYTFVCEIHPSMTGTVTAS